MQVTFLKQQTDKETVFLQAGSEINETNNLITHMKLKFEIDVDESLQPGLCFIYFLLWGSWCFIVALLVCVCVCGGGVPVFRPQLIANHWALPLSVPPSSSLPLIISNSKRVWATWTHFISRVLFDVKMLKMLNSSRLSHLLYYGHVENIWLLGQETKACTLKVVNNNNR